MAPSIFHYFSALPCELRLQIWELAIRPSGYTGGLHHFALSSTDAKDPKTDRESLTFLEPHQVQLNGRLELLGVPKIGRPEGDSSRNPAKQSVYFWDAGLWTACMESREVMVKRTKRIRHVEERGMLGPVSHVPEVVTVPEHGQPWQLMVVPRTDLFCFTPEAWGLRIDWQCIWFSLFSCRLPGQSVRHLAFEFNPSWNLDWPAHFSQLYHERSGCRFFARILPRLANMETRYSVWLIDRSTPHPQTESSSGETRRVFYDLSTEYVEAKREEIAWDANGDEAQNSARFIRNLATFKDRGCNNPIDWLFSIDYQLGVLTCGPAHH